MDLNLKNIFEIGYEMPRPYLTDPYRFEVCSPHQRLASHHAPRIEPSALLIHTK